MTQNLPLDIQKLKFKNIHFSTIQSLLIIATALVYYCNSNYQFINHNPVFGVILLPIVAIVLAYFFKKKTPNLKSWHFLVFLSVLALVFNYESNVHAQILDGIDGAIDGVGTAAGGSFATTVLDAVIELVRIAIYIAVAGAVIAGIIFGVTQGQWQAPVLVVGVIVGIGLFLEIMGEVVFG
ncbi:MAG: hypothetical protein AAFO95_16955 [Cyanobacteria bacterium J06600_6]